MHNKKTSIGGDAVRVTVSKVITLCITMATSMLLSRFRSFEEYGTYSQILLSINLVVTLLMLGLPNSINFFLARADTQEEQQRFLSVYYTLSTVLSIVIGTLLVLSIPLIEAFFHNPLIRGFWYFFAVYPWASIISSSIENVLVVFRQTRFLILYRIIYSVAMLGVVIVVQMLGFGFRVYMIAFVAVSSLFAGSVYLIVSYFGGGLSLLIDLEQIKALFTFSVPIGLAGAVGTMNAEIDKLLIGYLMNTEQLAIYTNAAKELPLSIVASSITAVLLPQLTRMIKHNKTREAIELWGDASELAFMIIALIVAGVFTYAEEAMTFLYSAKYLPGVNVFRVYTLNLLLRCTYFGMVLNACGETKKIFWCSVISLILNAILNPLFYWMFGMIGPAIATFVAILIIQQLQLKMTAVTVGVSFSEVFPWGRIAKITGINIALACVFYLIKKALPLNMLIGEVMESLLLGVIWFGLYIFIMRKELLDRWHKLNQTGDDTKS